MRGASAAQGDAHQTAFFCADPATGKRYLLLSAGKRRFESPIDEIEFEAVVTETMVMNALGRAVPGWLRHANCRAIRSKDRLSAGAKAKEESEELAVKEEERRIRGALLETVEEARRKQQPLSRTTLKKAVTGEDRVIARHIDKLIQQNWIVEIEIPKDKYNLTNNNRKRFLIELTREEKTAFETGGLAALPADKTVPPLTYAMPRRPDSVSSAPPPGAKE